MLHMHIGSTELLRLGPMTQRSQRKPETWFMYALLSCSIIQNRQYGHMGKRSATLSLVFPPRAAKSLEEKGSYLHVGPTCKQEP